jgi:glutathione S-transferase
MPLNSNAEIEITTLAWVPEGARGLVKDLRVRWALEEAGLDYRIRPLGGERPADYSQDQPFNQVPCLSDGTVRIFESGAILQYIGEKSEALLPSDPQAKFRAIQWTFAAVSSLEPFVQFRVLLDVLFAGQPWSEPAKPTFDHFAQLRLGQVAGWLGDKQWLEGDRFTIGDLMMVTVLRIASKGGLLKDQPKLAEYVARGEARPAFQRALADHLAGFATQPEGVAA